MEFVSDVILTPSRGLGVVLGRFRARVLARLHVCPLCFPQNPRMVDHKKEEKEKSKPKTGKKIANQLGKEYNNLKPSERQDELIR